MYLFIYFSDHISVGVCVFFLYCKKLGVYKTQLTGEFSPFDRSLQREILLCFHSGVLLFWSSWLMLPSYVLMSGCVQLSHLDCVCVCVCLRVRACMCVCLFDGFQSCKEQSMWNLLHLNWIRVWRNGWWGIKQTLDLAINCWCFKLLCFNDAS